MRTPKRVAGWLAAITIVGVVLSQGVGTVPHVARSTGVQPPLSLIGNHCFVRRPRLHPPAGARRKAGKDN
jgi:hypothetical protein